MCLSIFPSIYVFFSLSTSYWTSEPGEPSGPGDSVTQRVVSVAGSRGIVIQSFSWYTAYGMLAHVQFLEARIPPFMNLYHCLVFVLLHGNDKSTRDNGALCLCLCV